MTWPAPEVDPDTGNETPRTGGGAGGGAGRPLAALVRGAGGWGVAGPADLGTEAVPVGVEPGAAAVRGVVGAVWVGRADAPPGR
jgi:hypothetical protein